MDKELFVLHGEIKTPPMSISARRESGYLLRRLQDGEIVSAPACKPMNTIGRRCYELIVIDESKTWRIMVRIDDDAVLVLDVFAKKTQKTPQSVKDACKKRLKEYDAASR